MNKKLTAILEPGSSAVRRGRQFVREALAGCPGVVEDATLIASELITNAVSHGAGITEPIRVEVEVGDERILMTVSDTGRNFAWGGFEPGARGGFGLTILNRLATAWGVRRKPSTAIWCELERPATCS